MRILSPQEAAERFVEVLRSEIVAQHRERWLADYWASRSNPLSSSRRSRSGQRAAEAGRTREGALRWGLKA